MHKGKGFTLIELVITIIIIGILAVTVIPKFMGSSGYEDIAYQNEVITKLRAIQLRALQQTNQSVIATNCHTVKITAKTMGLLAWDGDLESCLADSYEDDVNCQNQASCSRPTSVIIEHENITFTESTFSFGNLGRLNCTFPCSTTITLQGGEQTKTITINAEGFIYASN